MDMFDHTSSSSVAVEQLMEQSVQNDRIFRRDTLLRVRKIQSVLTVSSMRKPSWAVTTISPTKEAPPRRTPVFSRREHERLVQATIKPSSILEREIVARVCLQTTGIERWRRVTLSRDR